MIVYLLSIFFILLGLFLYCAVQIIEYGILFGLISSGIMFVFSTIIIAMYYILLRGHYESEN